MRHNGIGELIITTPFLHHLRQIFPDHRISLLSSPYAVELFRHCTDVDELLILGHDEEKNDYRCVLPPLGGMSFDIFFCPQDVEPAAIVGRALDIPVRVGFDRHGNGQHFTHPVSVPDGLPKTRKLLYLLRPFCADADRLNPHLHLFVGAADVAAALRFFRSHGLPPDAPCVGLGIGGQPYKRWPWDRMAEIGRELEREAGAPCIVFAGNAEDVTEVRALARTIGGQTIVAHDLPLLQTAEVLRRCRYVLTNDSGLSWLAASVQTPSVILFRASGSMDEYKPEGELHLGIQAYRDPTDFTDKGIRQITLQDVRAGIRELQRSRGSVPPPAPPKLSEAFFDSHNILIQGQAAPLDNFKGPLHSCSSDAEFSESKDYVQRIFAGEVLVHRVRLDIARICLFRCPFCFSVLDKALPAAVEEQCIPLDMIRTLCAEFTRLGVRIVNLYGGGEPMLHPHAAEVLGMLAAAGVRIRIITNGSGLNAALRAALIRYRSHIDIVRFSLPGLSCRSHREKTKSRLFDLITASIREFAREVKRYPDAPEIGIYVPVFLPMEQEEVAPFLEYAAASGADWLFFREDTRSPVHANAAGSFSDPCAFPQIREEVRRLAKSHPGFPVYYNMPVAVPNATSICYFQLTDLILSYHAPARALVMVRCEHHIPGGIAELPAAGNYRLIAAADLYAECESQLGRFLADRRQTCPRPDHCYTYRRNLAIQEQLIREGRSEYTAGGLSPFPNGA